MWTQIQMIFLVVFFLKIKDFLFVIPCQNKNMVGRVVVGWALQPRVTTRKGE